MSGVAGRSLQTVLPFKPKYDRHRYCSYCGRNRQRTGTRTTPGRNVVEFYELVTDPDDRNTYFFLFTFKRCLAGMQLIYHKVLPKLTFFSNLFLKYLASVQKSAESSK